MNGTIMVQNNSGKGSRFIVTLPFKKEDFEGAEVNEIPVHDFTEMSNKVQVVIDNLSDDDATFEHSTLSISETPVVLVVEDNKELALFIANSLSSQYTMLLAENGKAGYEMAKKHSPDLIISDVMMPELDGIEMCRLLKNNLYTSHIPIILLSAKAQVENQLEGLQSGADDYVPKPFNLELLKAKVSNTIEARLRLRAMFTSQIELPRNLGNGQSLDDKFLSKLYEVLEASYTNPDFSVELFADAMFVSRSLLYKKLKALLDLSPNDFITVYRLKKSLPLLMSGEMSINEVAYTIGFNDPKYFSRVFKKFYKKTPSEYIVQQ
jgi:YesN/AraC family two-component response regulator